jgi:hypothetical protein
MRLSRRECLVALAVTALSGCKSPGSAASAATPSPNPGAPVPKPSGQTPLKNFYPEDFGAAGDGRTNDTAAFARMTEAVNAVGSGTIILQPTTYVIGSQSSGPQLGYAYEPAPIMEFDGCQGALTILGNGARLRCDDGLRFGTFNRTTGLATQNALPNYDVSQLASPYTAMITAQNCTGKIHIENLELDGNVAALIVGGPFGDTGWQIPATGLRLINNSGGETVKGVHSHHHALDGLLIDAAPDRSSSTVIQNFVSEFNARQGCSIVSGANFTFVDCAFNHTGKGGLHSAPGAGVDIEAETHPIRNLAFSNCQFSNNSGVGMIADSGDTESARFTDCRFIATSSWGAWPAKPKFRFEDCQFVGSICQTCADLDPERAAQFLRCSFTDDPALSPTREVYQPKLAIADLGSGDLNVRFDGCNFDLKNASVLPWTLQSTFNNCTMAQTSTQQSYPRGVFTGTNKIDGNVDLYGSKIIGLLTVNGKVIAPN